MREDEGIYLAPAIRFQTSRSNGHYNAYIDWSPAYAVLVPEVIDEKTGAVQKPAVMDPRTHNDILRYDLFAERSEEAGFPIVHKSSSLHDGKHLFLQWRLKNDTDLVDLCMLAREHFNT